MNTPKKFNISVFKDNRGSFIPIKLNEDWLQSNLSINDNLYTWRGLHFQVGPKRQSKFVSVIKGKIIDIIVGLTGDDLGKVEVYELNEGEGLFVPKGYAHGFLTLQSGTIVNYFVDEDYSKEHEVSVLWSSIPEVKSTVLSVIGNKNLVISDKDETAITFNEFLNNDGIRP